VVSKLSTQIIDLVCRVSGAPIRHGLIPISHGKFEYTKYTSYSRALSAMMHPLCRGFSRKTKRSLPPIFSHFAINNHAALVYGVYICQLIIYGYQKIRLIRSLKKFIFRYLDLVGIYSVSAETIISDAFSYSENV
jgi:hypothetical protein